MVFQRLWNILHELCMMTDCRVDFCLMICLTCLCANLLHAFAYLDGTTVAVEAVLVTRNRNMIEISKLRAVRPSEARMIDLNISIGRKDLLNMQAAFICETETETKEILFLLVGIAAVVMYRIRSLHCGTALEEICLINWLQFYLISTGNFTYELLVAFFEM